MRKVWFGTMCGEAAPNGEGTCGAAADHLTAHLCYVQRREGRLLYMWPRGARARDVAEIEKKLADLQAQLARLKGG